jgi:ankyrin repeat protein
MDIYDAIKQDHIEEVLSLLDMDPSLLEKCHGCYRGTPLVQAAYWGRLDMAKLLVRRGANIHAAGPNGTALHHAAKEGHEAIVAFLLSQGAQACSKDESGATPFMWAAGGRGSPGVMNLLLRHMGRQALYEKDGRGWTALHYAAQRPFCDDYAFPRGYLSNDKRVHDEMVTFLLSKRAHPCGRDEEGRTPLMFAARGGSLRMVRALVEYTTVRMLNVRDSKLRTSLHWAVEGGDKKVVGLLLKNKAQADAKDQDGQTPLILACQRGQLGVVRTLRQHMDEQGLQWRDGRGRTALHWAAEAGYDQVVRALLLAGANSRTCKEGKTPRTLAEEKRHPGCVNVFDVSMPEIYYISIGCGDVSLLINHSARE